MQKSRIILLFVAVLCISNASAVIIQGIEANQDEYSNGELVHLSIYTNQNNLQIIADFSNVDSNFQPGMVLVESIQDFTYDVYYPITFSNTRGDKIYNAIITAYDQATDTSSVISYGINLNNVNRIEKTESIQDIKIKIREKRGGDTIPAEDVISSIEDIKIEAGKIVVCRSDGCSELTEAEYDDARRVIIDGGNLGLSQLTYEQLKAEVISDMNDEVKADIGQYLNQIIQINKDVNAMINGVEVLINENEQRMENQTNRTEKYIKQARTFNIASIAIVALIVFGGLYLIYLRTNTTWLS